MSSAPSLVASIDPRSKGAEQERAELYQIDESSRLLALIFIGTAVAWLFVGTIFALIAAYKMHTPAFLGQDEWLTFGRVRTAHLNTVIYGWATNAGIAVTFWMMARLSRTLLRHAGILYVSGALWNLGVLVGTIGILRGDSQSVEWLEFPPYATPILFVAYALIGVWGVITFRFRRAEHTYVSQWYLLAALFWFPWLYSIAQILLIFAPTVGVVQSLTNWWFAHNVLGLWFTPIGLAAAYYFIPKVLGRPIHSYHLSIVGFWALAIFYNWAGVHHLIGGPIPVWVQSAGIVASLMMVIPVVVTAINHHFTVIGSFGQVWNSPTLRFIVFGAVNYTLTSLIGSTMSLRSVNQVTHFTHFTVGHAHHGMYAFFTMVMFGSIYYMLPRLLRKEWPSSSLISLHFWSTALGITIYVVGLSLGGVIQGLQLLDVQGYPSFLTIMAGTVPWLFSRTVAGVLMMVGHVAFAVSFVWILLKPRSTRESAPTLFNTPPPLKMEAS
jgi:cytochrome c oxidase cbb3-type subunit I